MSIKFRPSFTPAVLASLALLLAFMVIAIWLVRSIQSSSGVVDSLPIGLVPFLLWAGFASGLAGLTWLVVSRTKNRPLAATSVVLITAGVCFVLLSQILSITLTAQGR